MKPSRIFPLAVMLACAGLSACATAPDDASSGGKTRAQVKAELAEAIRLGDIRVGDSDKTLAEMYPARYAAVRAQAQAQAQAQRQAAVAAPAVAVQ